MRRSCSDSPPTASQLDRVFGSDSGRSSATTASDRDRSDLLYISRPHDGLVYVAQRSRNGSQRLLWSVIPREPFGPELRADAADVPREIRRQAYRHLGKVAVET